MLPTLGSSDLFPHLKVPHYLNMASIAPTSLPVQQAMADAVLLRAQLGMGAVESYAQAVERCRAGFGELVGAHAADVAVLANTSAGVVAIAQCLDWRPGDRIIVFRGDFPTNVTPWQQAAQAHGLQIVWVDGDGFRTDEQGTLDAVAQALAGGARLLAVSAVSFWSGQRRPVQAIATLCRRYGVELFVDGIQAAGIVPLSMSMGIDYLAVGGHKWLGGPFGIGCLAVAPSRWSGLKPRLASWLSHTEPLRFLMGEPGHLREDKPIQVGPALFEGGAFNGVGAAGLAAALDVVNALGQPAITTHVHALCERLATGLAQRGYPTYWSEVPRQRGGAVVTPLNGVDVGALVGQLGERGFSVASPNARLRVAPGWFNNTQDVDALLDALDELLPTR